MLSSSRATLLIGIAVSGALLSACAQAGAHPLVLLLGAVIVIPLARVASRAGAPIPCSGYEARSCVDGRILEQCCPQGASSPTAARPAAGPRRSGPERASDTAKCNFESRPFIDCGAGLCTERDRGHCPDPVPSLAPADQCGESWELACVAGVVQKSCIPAVPTNYTGPPLNPPFSTCGEWPGQSAPAPGMACTTNALPERCYPGKADAKPVDGPVPARPPREIPAAACGVVPWGGYAGLTARWTEVCLDGRVVERCLPTTRPGGARFESTLFTKLDGGRCALRAP